MKNTRYIKLPCPVKYALFYRIFTQQGYNNPRHRLLYHIQQNMLHIGWNTGILGPNWSLYRFGFKIRKISYHSNLIQIKISLVSWNQIGLIYNNSLTPSAITKCTPLSAVLLLTKLMNAAWLSGLKMSPSPFIPPTPVSKQS